MIQPLPSTLAAEAVATLKQGGLVVYPTESSYALGCDSRNKKAVVALYRLKSRLQTKQLPVIAASRAMAERFFYLNGTAKKIARRHWPGPLTILLAPKKKLPVSELPKVAVRVSAHPLARRLARGLGAPVVSTSANKSGSAACYSVAQLRRQLPLDAARVPLLIIDAGTLPHNAPSTIIDVRDNHVVVLRKGKVKKL